MTKLFCVLCIAMLCTGCGHREVAKAALQAQQAIDASVKLIDTSPKDAKLLLHQAHESLSPVLDYLSDGQTIKVDTTVEEATTQPETFVHKATVQAARAGMENEMNQRYSEAASFGYDTLMAALMGSGGAGLVIAKVLSTIKKYKTAVQDQIDYHKDVADAAPEEKIAIQQKHKKRQIANGTHAIIEEHLNARRI